MSTALRPLRYVPEDDLFYRNAVGVVASTTSSGRNVHFLYQLRKDGQQIVVQTPAHRLVATDCDNWEIFKECNTRSVHWLEIIVRGPYSYLMEREC